MLKARLGRFSMLMCAAAVLFFCSSNGYAKTRIKTVEWSFGSYFNSSDLASGSVWTAPTITVSLPETGKTIKNAFLELECWTYGTSDVSNVDIRFDQGSSASTIRDVITSDYSNNTGEHLRIFALADVTGVISTNAAQQYTASVSVTGSPTNSHSLKLYITYEYDSTSETQVKTCLLYTSPSPRDRTRSRMPSSA